MAEERLALPGFMTPDHPKEGFRVFARPDGRVELVLKEHVPLEASVPDYQILISTEYGPEVHLHATVRNGMVVQIRDDAEGTQKFVLRVGPPCLTFTPATYMVRAMDGDTEVYVRALTVLNHSERLRKDQLAQAQGSGGTV